MNDLLSDKSVIFFDVGFTIDYPAFGDWMFTNIFNEKSAGRLTRDIDHGAHGWTYEDKKND